MECTNIVFLTSPLLHVVDQVDGQCTSIFPFIFLTRGNTCSATFSPSSHFLYLGAIRDGSSIVGTSMRVRIAFLPVHAL